MSYAAPHHHPVPPPRPLLSRLFARRDDGQAARPDAPATDVPADPRRSELRRLYDDIGQFLFAHQLDLTPLNFGCVQEYLGGDDRRLVADIDQALLDNRLSDGWIEDYLAGRQGSMMKPETLIDLAAQVEGELDRCLMLVSKSAEQATGYTESLSAGTGIANPEAMMAHLVELTREMIEQTRQVEGEMRESHRETSKLRTTLRAARRASELDHLTGLPNRRGFERRVKEMCAAHRDRQMVLALCDIDHFKAVNDRFGHDTGDRVLKFIARELGAIRRKGAEVARLGGEEFVILLPDCPVETAASEIDLLRGALETRRLIDRETQAPVGNVTFSAGVTAIEGGAEGLKPALRRADAALYAAKHAGRNRIYAAGARGELAPVY